MTDAVKYAIEIMEKTNEFWRDSLRDYNVPESVIKTIYVDADFAVQYFKKKYEN